MKSACPADHLWGAQTQRSIDNFPIGVAALPLGPPGDPRVRHRSRRRRREANAELGELPPTRSQLIVRAAQEVIDGKLDGEFPLVVFQTGSGTQTNMNANEVIANRAIQLAGGVVGSKKPVHPNDDVNRGQSSNDAFPTVMHIAAVEAIEIALLPALDRLRDTLHAKADAFAGVVMVGRTHLQDATPVTLGQVIGGLGGAARPGARRARVRAPPGCIALAIGGTAVGTGLNAHPQFGDQVARADRAQTGKPFTSGANKFALLSAHDAMVNASAALRTLGGALMKIANDVRWYASGPRAGFGEFTHSGERAGLVDHAGQDQPDAMRGADAWWPCRCSATTRRWRSPARRATSSSTSTSR